MLVCSNLADQCSMINQNTFSSHQDPTCTWLTYYPDTSFCHLLANCSSLDTQDCIDCLSGQHNCIPNEPACSIQGNCIGIRIHAEKSPSQEDCLQLCDSFLGCRWFSFYPSGSECILFQNCPTIDESCEDCVSGERRCIDETTSTTPEVTSTTPEVTSTTPEWTTTESQKGDLNSSSQKSNNIVCLHQLIK
jgi:hypothetical protein